MKEHKTSLQTVQRHLYGFDDNIVYYVYLKMNEQHEEAEQFLKEYAENFKTCFNNLSSPIVEEDVNRQQHDSSPNNDKS